MNFYSFVSKTLRQKNFRSAIVLLFFMIIMAMLIELVIPFVTKAIVDQGINNQDIAFINLVLLSLLMLSIGAIANDVFRAWLLRQISVRIRMDINDDYLNRILQKNTQFYSSRNDGEFVQILNDNNRIEKFFTENVTSFFEYIIRMVVYSIILFQFNVWIGTALLISIALNMIYDSIFFKNRAIQDRLQYNARTITRGDIIEIINGVTDIKVNNLETERKARWSVVQKVLARSSVNILKFYKISETGIILINRVRDIIIIYLAATSVVAGSLTLGGMLAIQYIIGQLNRQINAFTKFVMDYQEAQLSFDRSVAFLNDEYLEDFAEAGLQEIPPQATINIENLSFSYDEAKVIKNISLQIPYQTKVAIVGESGSGKSTLVKLILKLLSTPQGTIKIGNTKLNHINTQVWRDQCSILLQESTLFNASVKYNITLQNENDLIDFQRLDEIIELCKIREIVDGMSQGVNTLLGKEGTSLSKGQAQRVMLARALYKNANYLIVDEPTSALDALTAFTVFENMKSYFEDRTIILITHKINIARQMDLIFVMENGNILEQGTHESLMEKQGKYYQLATIK